METRSLTGLSGFGSPDGSPIPHSERCRRARVGGEVKGKIDWLEDFLHFLVVAVGVLIGPRRWHPKLRLEIGLRRLQITEHQDVRIGHLVFFDVEMVRSYLAATRVLHGRGWLGQRAGTRVN